MSLAQQIRDAMRRIGGPATSTEIAEQCEDEPTASDVSTRLNNGEAQGWVMVDRSERPLRYTLIEAAAAKAEAFVAKNPMPRRGHPTTHERAVASKPERAPKPREKQSVPPPAPSLGQSPSLNSTAGGSAPATAAPDNDSDRSRRVNQEQPKHVTAAAETLAREIDRVTQASLPRALVLRLCALALSPDDRSANDLRDIATAIKAAA